MKLINGQFYNVTKQRYTGITAKKTRGRWQYRDAETGKLYASGITPAQFAKEFWFTELIEDES